MGAELFWELIFFLGINFFSMVPIENGKVSGGGGPAAGGGLGGVRSASPPDAFPEHATWFACRVFRHGA